MTTPKKDSDTPATPAEAERAELDRRSRAYHTTLAKLRTAAELLDHSLNENNWPKAGKRIEAWLEENKSILSDE
jgi:hypothetical protein